MTSSKKTQVILWVGVAAAAAGIGAVVAVVKWKERSLSAAGVTERLRDVQDVLTDCYNKISEIEQQLPQIADMLPATRSVRSLTNGRPAYDR